MRHDVKLSEPNTLSVVVSTARLVENNRSDCKRSQVQRPQFLGKRPSYSSLSMRSYRQSFGPQSKKQKFFKKPVSIVVVDDAPSEKSESQPMYHRCYGPHEESACKWMPGACYSCGIVGHKSSECKNPTLKPVSPH